MPTVEIQLSDSLEAEIQQMVDQGEFLTREQAHEELLAMGLSAYAGGPGEEEEGLGQEIADQTFDQQQDPAMRDESGDGQSGEWGDF